MVSDVVGAGKRQAATERMVTLGFIYPDALDIRSALPRGYSHVPGRGPVAQSNGALPLLTPDPGSANEPTAAQSQSH